jgi:hypothetical protein
MLAGMRIRFAAVLAACALGAGLSPSRAAEAPAAATSELPAGRYGIPIKGMLCAVDARAIAAEWGKLAAVEKAAVDFESGRATVTVRLGQTLSLSKLRRALRRAERTANLGAHYEFGDVSYLP